MRKKGPIRTICLRLVTTGLLGLAAASPASSQPRVEDPLAAARQLYNDRRYDAAIEAATTAARLPGASPAASVIVARAHLERFRQTGEAGGLNAARDALRAVDATRLSPRDHVEYLIGLGESLYLDEEAPLDDRYAAAAELFEAALGQIELLDARGRDLLFEWWAIALDQQAQQSPMSTRPPLYERIVAKASAQAARPDASASALYWLAAGAAGMNDPQRAWGAAVAAWIRSGSLGARGVALRADIDRLMNSLVLPGRARQLAPTGDQETVLAVIAAISEQWAEFKKKWAR